MIFTDRMSRCTRREETVWFGNLRVTFLLFVDDVVLLSSSSQDIQLALKRFSAKCEVAGITVSSSKSEALVLNQKKVECSLCVRDESLPQTEEFKYLFHR